MYIYVHVMSSKCLQSAARTCIPSSPSLWMGHFTRLVVTDDFRISPRDFVGP